MPALISNGVLSDVRFKNGATLYDFGSLEIREVQLSGQGRQSRAFLRVA